LRKALKGVRTKEHKERSQPSDRKHLGFLEKHKDYVKRARNYHRKEDHLRLLREKASMRNPDEFYFGMEKSRLRRGVHSRVEGSATGRPNAFSSGQLKEMDSQDLAHMEMARQMERKRIERLRGRLHMLEQQHGGEDDYDALGGPDRDRDGDRDDDDDDDDGYDDDDGKGAPERAGPGPSRLRPGAGSHTLFLDDEAAVASFDPAKHFQTAPQLVNRAFNRPRLSQLTRGNLVWAARGSGGGGGSGASARKAQKGSKARRAQEEEEMGALIPGNAVLRRAERRRQAQYRELANRMEREAKMGRVVDELKARKDARGKGRKVKIGELKGEGPVAGGNAVPIYRWVKERKK